MGRTIDVVVRGDGGSGPCCPMGGRLFGEKGGAVSDGGGGGGFSKISRGGGREKCRFCAGE